MGRFVKVTSIDVVERFAAALKVFEDDAKGALDAVDMEVRKALDWIGHEQKEYWTERAHRGADEVHLARQQLERKRMLHPGDDRPSCHDERLALEAAKRRLRIAQEKIEAVRRWSHRAEQEVNEYIGAVSQLRRWIEHEQPRAQADLARMARALEDYVALDAAAEAPLPDDLAALLGQAPPAEQDAGNEPAAAAPAGEAGEANGPTGEREADDG